MAARKDLLKAHAFTQQRLVSALVDRDPDNTSPPLRRLGLGLFVSIIIGAVAVAGFGLYGYLKKPGNDAWAEANTIIIDNTSGGVFVTADGTTLNPVTNITSARLITGGEKIVTVRTSSLAGAERGPTYGIKEAPAQLPDPANMAAFPMRVCSLPNERDYRFTTVDFNAPSPSAGTAVALITGTGSGQRTYVVVDGTAHAVESTAMLTKTTPMPASEKFLTTLPQGAALGQLVVDGKGTKSNLGTVGEIVSTGQLDQPASLRYWVLLSDGYSQLSWLDAQAAGATGVVNKPATQVTSNRSPSKPSSATEGIPIEEVQFTSADTSTKAVCATYTADSPRPVLTVGDTVAAPKSRAGGDAFDRVSTTPGGGALLRSTGAFADGATFLIWAGRKYGIPDPASRTALGYDSSPAIRAVLPQILKLIPDGLPAGVALDHDHANRPA